jgi:acetyl esterase/lipase
MPFVHKCLAKWAFPFSARATQAVGMTALPMSAQRVAELRLRSSGGALQTRVWWPHSPSPGAPPGLLMFFVDTGADVADREAAWLRDLASRAGVVVVAVSCALIRDIAHGACLDNAMAALEWAADHARELEADPRRLVVGGTGTGAALAAAAALRARDRRWPPIARQLLVQADFEGAGLPELAAAADDVAPATVVTLGAGPHRGGREYAARLRQSSVEVDELHCDRPDRLVDEVALSLRASDSAATS